MYVLAFVVNEILEVGGASEASPVGCAISSDKYVLIYNEYVVVTSVFLQETMPNLRV